MTISSPCRGLCVLDPAGTLCTGCGRTIEEIAGWIAMPENERRRVMAQLPLPFAARAPAAGALRPTQPDD